MSDNTDYIFKAFVVNTNAYDNGERENAGTWLHFPASSEDINAALSDIGLPKDAVSDMYFMDDYVCSIDGIRRLLPMYGELSELTDIATELSKLSQEDKELLSAIQGSPYQLTEMQQLKEFSHNTECFILEPHNKTVEDVGWRWFEHHLDVDIPENCKAAIDPYPFEQHVMDMEKGYLTNRGYLSPSGDPWVKEQPVSPKKEADKKPSIKEQLKQTQSRHAQPSKKAKHEPEL